LHTFFVYFSDVIISDKSTLIEITNQLTTNMRARSRSALQELIAEGKEEGIIIGIEKGIEQGIEKGSIQSRYDFARKLIQRKTPIEDICDLTSLSHEEVQALIEKGN
jgi:predicted transposase/invertase (TIGR01784 family)